MVKKETKYKFLKAFLFGLKKILPLTGTTIAIWSVFGLFMVSEVAERYISEKTSAMDKTIEENQKAKEYFYFWKDTIKSDMEQGSEVGIDQLFLNNLGAFEKLYWRFDDPNISDSEYRITEEIIVDIKMPIYIRTTTLEPKINNYCFKLLKVEDTSVFSDSLTCVKQDLYFKAEFDSLISREVFPVFRAFIEPGMRPPDINDFKDIIKVEVRRNGGKYKEVKDFYKIKALGSCRNISPLYELLIQLVGQMLNYRQ